MVPIGTGGVTLPPAHALRPPPPGRGQRLNPRPAEEHPSPMTTTSDTPPPHRARSESGSGEQGHGGWTSERAPEMPVLADGTVVEGRGLGPEARPVGEVSFNTAMTGYQEILTDPSYAGQIITFTFPHIGNTGT